MPSYIPPVIDPEAYDNALFTVASQAAMLALDAHKGDIAVRTDFDPDRSYMLTAEDPTVVGNWAWVASVQTNPTNHSHDGTGDQGVVLAQANTHGSADTDAGPTSKHHTIGTGANQACGGADTRLSDARTPNSHGSDKHDGTVASAAVSAMGVLGNSNPLNHARYTDGEADARVAAGITGKADKAVPAAAGNFASLNAQGNLADSGAKAADYAVAAKGVTGGDSHAHTGGQGAQIAYSGLSGLPTLGTAAAQDVGAFAPAAQGVAGGSSHAHIGGEGALLAYANITGLPTLGDSAAKNVGTGAGDVAAGNHAHAALYEPIAAVYGAGNSGASKEIDWANGSTQTLAITEATVLTFANPVAGRGYRLKMTWGGAGYAVTLPTIHWEAKTAPTFDTTNGAVNWLVLFYDGAVYTGGALLNVGTP